MHRSGVITSIGFLLAFASGWLMGRAGTNDAITSAIETPPASVLGGSSSARLVTEVPPARLEAPTGTPTVAGLRIAPTNLPPAEPPTSPADAVVRRRELTPSAVDEHYDLLRSTLFSAAQGLVDSCYVDLRQATLSRLVSSLDSTDRQRACAAIDALVDAEYRYRAMENTILLEKFIWKQPPPQAGGSGTFLGKAGTLKAGQIEFDYVLNCEEYPQLAKANTDRLAARKMLAPFLPQ